MKEIILSILISFTFLIKINAQEINPKESKVEFKIGAMGFTSVKGTITEMKGLVKFDKSDLKNSKFDVTVSPKSINTENEKRDEHLMNEDFFNVNKYLTLHFKSTSIIKTGESYIAKGKLTILEITKEIELPFVFTQNGNKTIFTGEIEVNRFDYGLGAAEYKSSFMVGEIANVKITCVVD